MLLVLAMIAAVLVSVGRGLYRDGPLEPDAPTGQGSKAVVQVLEDLGVEVDVDRHTADAVDALDAGRTVLVTAPDDLDAQQLTALADAHTAGDGRLVLVQPDFVTLSYLPAQITPAGTLSEQTRLTAGPGCGEAAHHAQQLEVPDEADGVFGAATVYRSGGGATGCFDAAEGSLVVAGDRLLVLGSADLLSNDGVSRADNSALVLNALSTDRGVTWYVPSPTDPMGTASQTLVSHLPDWAPPLLLWAGLIVIVALLAASRRLGPVVVEPLPVSVRPQELVLGRARLLQRSGSRDAAAASLRAAAAGRLADRLGLRRESALDALLAALAPHADRSEEQLRALLGPQPVRTDHDLVRLAHDLDRLEKEIDR